MLTLLQQVGYQVHQAASLYQARVFLKRPPTLVILILNSLMVMESSSAGGCSDSNSPTLMLSARNNTEADIVAGLKMGQMTTNQTLECKSFGGSRHWFDVTAHQ